MKKKMITLLLAGIMAFSLSACGETQDTNEDKKETNPLLYYTGKLAVARGYKLVKVEYGNFPSGIKENKEKMEEAFRCGLEQAEKILQDICWEEYEDILFVSKSIGTVISSAFARRHQLSAKNILFTPLQQTFLFADGNGIVFHGTADPWADTKDITEGCKKLNLPLILTDEGNHSLETGDTLKDLENLQQIIGLLFNSLDK